MFRRILSTAGLLLVLVAPATLLAVAADTAYTPRAPHVGDVYRYEARGHLRTEDTHVQVNQTLVATLEAPGERLDRYGNRHATVPVLVEVRNASGPVSTVRCHLAQGTFQAVQTDILMGDPATSTEFRAAGLLFGPGLTKRWTDVTAVLEPAPCMSVLYQPTGLAKGSRLAFTHTVPGLPFDMGPYDPLSQAATWIEYRDRPALAVRFGKDELFPRIPPGWDVDGRVDLLYLDGVPGAALARDEVRLSGKGFHFDYGYVIELTGFTPGTGGALAFGRGNGPVAAVNPEAEMVLANGVLFDEASFQPAYPFKEAMGDAWLWEEFQEYRDTHPGAALVGVRYEREGRLDGMGTSLRTDGKWEFAYWHTNGSYHVEVARAASWRNPGLPVFPGDNPLVETRGTPALPPWVPPDQTNATLHSGGIPRADPETALAPARAFGLDPATVPWFSYTLVPVEPDNWTHSLRLSDVPLQVDGEAQGLEVELDPVSGGVRSLADARARGALALILPIPLDFQPASAPAAANPISRWVPPGEARDLLPYTMGLAILLVALKLLLPFYSRLRREHLLSHPLRARLRAFILDSPGIARHDLVARAGAHPGVVRYHLATLVRHGFLVETTVARGVCYYVPGTVPASAIPQAALLRRPSARRVHDLFAAEPGLSLREAARRLGMSAPAVHRHRKRLEAAGLLPRLEPPEAPGGGRA